MGTKEDQPQCCKMVRGEGQWGWLPSHQHQCRKRGKVQRNGEWYCGIHDPVTVEKRIKEKSDARMDQWKRESEMLARSTRRLKLTERLIKLAAMGNKSVEELRDLAQRIEALK